MRWLDSNDPDDRAIAADFAREEQAEARERPRPAPRFDTCWGCGVYLPAPKMGGVRFCADCRPHFAEMIAGMEASRD